MRLFETPTGKLLQGNTGENQFVWQHLWKLQVYTFIDEGKEAKVQTDRRGQQQGLN